jgi:hypothetical protein
VTSIIYLIEIGAFSFGRNNVTISQTQVFLQWNSWTSSPYEYMRYIYFRRRLLVMFPSPSVLVVITLRPLPLLPS